MRSYDSFALFARRLVACVGLWALLVACGLSGCGNQEYHERLKRTANYYAYLEQLDSHLQTARWSSEVVSLRVPKQFRPIDSTEAVPEGFAFLEGRLGQWHYDFRVHQKAEQEKTEQEKTAKNPQKIVVKQPGYLFVVGNHNRLLKKANNIRGADIFVEDLVQQFHQSVQKNEPAKSQWVQQSLPKTHKWTTVKTFSVFRITAVKTFKGLNGSYDFFLYTHSQSVVQVGILFAIPHNIDPDEQMTKEERIRLCLETLQISEADILKKLNRL